MRTLHLYFLILNKFILTLDLRFDAKFYATADFASSLGTQKQRASGPWPFWPIGLIRAFLSCNNKTRKKRILLFEKIN